MPDRVLLVDDEVEFAALLAERLAARGLSVVVAHDAEQALRVLRGRSDPLAPAAAEVDVAVLDVNLPGKSGLDILRELKAELPHVEAIMLTGAAEVGTAVAGMKLGAVDYLLKPVDVEVLVAAIRQATGRRAEKLAGLRMIETGKLAAVGGLAEGVAHEINNPVNIMFHEAGWMDDLLADADIPDKELVRELRGSIARIQTQGRRCRSITAKLLSLGGRIDPRPQRIRPDRLAAAALKAAKARAKGLSVRLTSDFARDIPELFVPPAHLEQVFSHLVDNALDAMEDRGGELRITGRREGDAVVFVVSDTGGGISPASLPHIFDPFFSTKEVGKGSGLGLPICRGIMTTLGGDVQVESQSGQGTSVTVTLPVEPYRSPVKEEKSVGGPARSM
ncbi:sensor histidine kinase [Desulfolutivibrio sulfoxidireducens]|uniref:sensor histidine kinase n=1 Tax=Desulfolutivibrio sulfoxidireducens TaxID=2773299 RepID=UPI00159D90F8|nr:hybrid sensor histidine kinase/response regulator [Desulfolutivibrio sulfoxidireducens]QLA16140.1 response regulator [Desulfolutivibrio sulfoxidireducens]QLA19963.1 response regulator [Desulfolutivibrio sulfoxidireducens]